MQSFLDKAIPIVQDGMVVIAAHQSTEAARFVCCTESHSAELVFVRHTESTYGRGQKNIRTQTKKVHTILQCASGVFAFFGAVGEKGTGSSSGTASLLDVGELEHAFLGRSIDSRLRRFCASFGVQSDRQCLSAQFVAQQTEVSKQMTEIT